MREQPQLADMIKGQVFDGYLLVRQATQRTSTNGSKYLDLTHCTQMTMPSSMPPTTSWTAIRLTCKICGKR